MNCTNQFKILASSKKDVDVMRRVNERGEKCDAKEGCFDLCYYQLVFPRRKVDVVRNCELMMKSVE